MKTASTALIDYLATFRLTYDAPLCMADIYKIVLANGSAQGVANGDTYYFTSLDVPILSNGHTYSNNSLLIDGLKYKAQMGLSVDTQDVTISATPAGMTFGGVPFLQALRVGLFDGAEILRSRVFFTTFAAPAPLIPIGDPSGAVLLFKGRVTEIKSIGRTNAKVTVASDLTLLTIEMPRRRYMTNCNHVLYDEGCSVNPASFTTTGAVASGSSTTIIYWTGAVAAQEQGSMTFTSGVNDGITATIKYANPGVGLILSYPLIGTPGVGDGFSISQGCDHTLATCASRFSNEANFLGFPFLPPPQILTGPLASTATQGKG